MTGKITTVQRFSLHDGPGIRSTVFFKGCGMHCPWCHNPETLSGKEELLFYRDKCVGCGACTAVSAACTLENGKMCLDRAHPEMTPEIAKVCFSGALERCGKDVTAEQVMEEVLQDEDYYLESGGGVTLSGGEVLLQADFALKLLYLCKEHNISTAIESCMNTSSEILQKLLPELDLVMCDLKIFDDDAHRKWTGAGNAQIKKNIRLADEAGLPLILRTPVIPGVNDSEEEILKIAEFAAGLKNLLYYELLNFNPLGASKYDALQKTNMFRDARPLAKERMDALAEAAAAAVSNVRIG